jgi:hypothetical protein
MLDKPVTDLTHDEQTLIVALRSGATDTIAAAFARVFAAAEPAEEQLAPVSAPPPFSRARMSVLMPLEPKITLEYAPITGLPPVVKSLQIRLFGRWFFEFCVFSVFWNGRYEPK